MKKCMKWCCVAGALLVIFSLSLPCFAQDKYARISSKEVVGSGVFIEFKQGVIAPYGVVPYIEVYAKHSVTRIYRTGEVYEVIDRSPEKPEFHRLNYWIHQ